MKYFEADIYIFLIVLKGNPKGRIDLSEKEKRKEEKDREGKKKKRKKNILFYL